MTTASLVPGQTTAAPPHPYSPPRETDQAQPLGKPERRAGADDWPRTSRIGPWALAGFIAMLWLVPFNGISMRVSLPFELKLDRIILPLVVTAWCLSLVMGKKPGQRRHLTPVHVAVGTFIAVEFMSDILNLTVLNRELLVSQALKALVLLSAYAIFFTIVANVVRASEVKAYLKYMLVLASLCAVGTLWEYEFHYNVFYQLATTLFPSNLFNVQTFDPSAVDELGRRMTMGPSQQPLELTTMVSLALPIALVGVMFARGKRDQILYGLAACLLLSAGVATFRKSAFITPAAVVLTLLLLSPRRVVRLLPGLPVLFVAIHVLAPGAIGSVFTELFGGNVGAVGTTQHRVAAYEFARPYVWTNPLLGIGYGTYGANLNRIFDSQVIDTLLDSGILGLTTYLAMMVTALCTARSVMRRQGGEFGRLALALGAGSVAFFVSSFLYDAMGFPHGPYIFFAFAGLVAVLARAPHGERAPMAQSYLISIRPAKVHRRRQRYL